MRLHQSMSELESASLSEEKTKAEVEIFSAFQQFLRLLSDVNHSEERSKQIVAMRGQHVHQTHLIPREISRVGLIETFMKTDFLQDQMPILHRLALNDARRTWRNNAKTMSAVASILIARALRSTEYIWRPAIETALQVEKSAKKLDRLSESGRVFRADDRPGSASRQRRPRTTK